MAVQDPPTQAGNAMELQEQHSLPLVVAAKAAVLNPPPDLGAFPDNWWRVQGVQWIRQLCTQLRVNPRTVADAPTRHDVQIMRDSGLLPRELDEQIVLLLVRISLVQSDTKMTYEAAVRALLVRTLEILEIRSAALWDAERQIAAELLKQVNEAESRAQTERARQQRENGWGGKIGRWAATGAGVVLGGVALGVTGGLAAPLLLSLVPFLGLSPIVLGSLFGLAGGGLAGYRVRRRWAGVDSFEFIPLSNETPSMVATILVPGLQVGSEIETVSAARAALHMFQTPAREVFYLSHSPQLMHTVGKTLDDWVVTQVLPTTTLAALRLTVLGAAVSALTAPLVVYTAVSMVDNDWVRACDKANKAGELLAEVLRERVQGARPVVLVASSLGALVVFRALLHLPPEAPPLIDSVIFIGAPMTPSMREWRAMRRVVARRIVNAWCPTDAVLATVARMHAPLKAPPMGLKPTPFEGVEDIDISDIIEGHFDISLKYEAILSRVRASE